RRRVAERTADRREQPTTPRNRRGAARRVWGRLRRGQESHEEGKLLDVADGDGHVRAVRRRNVVGLWLRLTPRRLVPLRLEEFARDAHLDVVGLAREQQERLVLRLPAEPRNGPVVAVEVEHVVEPADAKRRLLRSIEH